MLLERPESNLARSRRRRITCQRKATTVGAVGDSVANTPNVMATANRTPAAGTPLDIAKRHDEQSRRACNHSSSHTDEKALSLAMAVGRSEERAPKHPKTDHTEQAPGEVFERGHVPGTAEHARDQGQREPGDEHRHPVR
jgi:hypothetical protein